MLEWLIFGVSVIALNDNIAHHKWERERAETLETKLTKE